MKILKILCALLIFTMCACNHSEEPPTEVTLSIQRQFRPVSVQFSMSDTDFVEMAKEYDNKDIIVNSLDEFPDDPIGFTDGYRNIDFNTSTLLLAYRTYRWDYETYENRFLRNRIENCYYWQINLGVTYLPEELDSGLRIFNRFAIIVKKLPEGSDVKFQILHSSTI